MKKILKCLLTLTLCVCACTMFACKDKNKKGEVDDYEPITVVNVDYSMDDAMVTGSRNLYLSDKNNRTYAFSFELEPKEASWKDLDITISNKGVVSLDGQTVVAKKVGSSTISFKAKKGDFEKSVTFNVTDPDFYSNSNSDGNYHNLSELGNKLKNGNNVTLLKDITAESGMFTFGSNVNNVTINLNGHSVNLKDNTITLEGENANIEFYNHDGTTSKIFGTSTILYANCNKVTATNVNFESSSQTAYVVQSLNTMELKNCTIKGYNGIATSGNLTLKGSNTLVDAKNKAIVATGTSNRDTTVNFSNGTITSQTQGVLVNGNAKFVMDSGTISATNEAVLGDGTTNMNIVLKSGTITSTKSSAVLVNSLGDSYIGCYPSGSLDYTTNDLTLSGKPAVTILQGNVKVGSPTIVDTNNQIAIRTNTVAGDLSFKFLTTTPQLTAKISTAMKDDKSDVKVEQTVTIDRTYGNFAYEELELKFASTELTLESQANKGSLTIRPVTPIYFDGTIVYEFNNNDNFQFQTLDSKTITPTQTETVGARYDSKIELTIDNGFVITWSGNATQEIPGKLEIQVTYKPNREENKNQSIILTITINNTTTINN